MHTLAEINAALVSAGIDPAALTQIIADIKASVRASDAGVIADLTSKLATLPAITAERDAHAKTIADYLAADDAGKAKMLADAAKSAEQKAIEAAEAKVAEAARVADEAARELAALKAKQ
jgi:hypothetical protein